MPTKKNGISLHASTRFSLLRARRDQQRLSLSLSLSRGIEKPRGWWWWSFLSVETRERALLRPDSMRMYIMGQKRERGTRNTHRESPLTVSPFLRFSGGQKTREKNNTQNTIEWISLSFSSRSFLINSDGIFLLSFALFFPSLKKKKTLNQKKGLLT